MWNDVLIEKLESLLHQSQTQLDIDSVRGTRLLLGFAIVSENMPRLCTFGRLELHFAVTFDLCIRDLCR